MKHIVAVVVFENHAALVYSGETITRNDLKNDCVRGWRPKTKTKSQQVVWLMLSQDIRWWAGGEKEDDGVQRVETARRVCAGWNPILGAIGYPPSTFKKVLRELGVDPTDAT